jgi:hypothetical protein
MDHPPADFERPTRRRRQTQQRDELEGRRRQDFPEPVAIVKVEFQRARDLHSNLPYSNRNCSARKNWYADYAESTDFAEHLFEKTLRYFKPSAQSVLFREIRVHLFQSHTHP